ncbi:MAG TPA: HIT family protein [Burkholderiales bacterium]|nr:HIT family protein [Burkholderiales bacterium]
MDNCVFCKIVAGQIPASVVYQDEQTIAFMDIGQVNPGHVLVVVKPHIENVFGLDDTLASAVMRTTARVARALKASFAPDGVNLFQANGAAAEQTVFHFHVHVLPRRNGDGMKLVWPAKNPPREELEKNAARLRAAL